MSIDSQLHILFRRRGNVKITNKISVNGRYTVPTSTYLYTKSHCVNVVPLFAGGFVLSSYGFRLKRKGSDTTKDLCFSVY